ncbi:MAG: hypothetical protein QHH17_00285 [Candidatus Bathyarchaeota archaeon]|jgi:hypothetical protein|nr:hypothetical protein [Candidatus Bathyarchaeota archaeon]
MKSKDHQSNVKKSSTALPSLYKLAFLTGAIGLGFSALLIYIYYAHIFTLPDIPIEAARYMASTHSIAMTFFTLSFSLGLIALLNYKDVLSFKLMLASTATALLGYLPPSERLWRLGYTNSLKETIAIAIIHVALLTTSATLLNKALKRNKDFPI